MTYFTLSEHRHGRTSTAKQNVYATLFFAIALALALSLLGTDRASAKDLSLPYRDYPGFTCHAWNSRGECTDFSYYDGPSSYAPPATYRPTTTTTRARDCYDSYGRYDSRYCRNTSRYTGSVTRDRDCYDSYGRYDARYCDDRYRSGDVTVRVTGTPNPVYQGDLLTYSIYLRNDGSSNRTIDVSAFLDPDTFFHSASDRGQSYRSDEVRWDRLSIRARSSATLSLTVRIDPAARDGDMLRLTVEADGDEDEVETEVRDDNDRYRDCYDRYGRYDSRYCDNSSNNRDRDCYDSYGRYNERYCDDRYGEDVTVQISSSMSDARPGELITYRIVLENDDSVGRNIDVRAFLDADTDYYSSSDSGRERNRGEVEWDNVYVDRDSTRTLSVSVRVDQNARINDTLYFRAEADGDEDEITTRVR